MNKTFSSQKEVKVEHDQRHRRNADKGEIMSTGDTNKKRNAFLSGQVRLHQQSELSDTLWEGLTWQRPLRGAISVWQDALTACFPPYLPPSLLLSLYSLLFLLISEVSPWEKLDSFYFVVIIHIRRIENSQMKIYTTTVKIKQLYLTPPEAS